MLGRAWFLALCFALLTALLAGRLFQLQVLHGDRYAEDVAQSRLSVTYIPARRGRILDRHGTALVDNRAVYDVAVVLSKLELDRGQRQRIRFLRFDRRSLREVVSEFSARTYLPPEEIEAVVAGSIEAFPATAVRYGESVDDGEPGLLALPQATFVDAAHALAGDSAEADRSVVEAIDPKLAALAESGLLHDDPREALEREFALRRGPGAVLLTQGELEELLVLLAADWGVPGEMLAAVIEPFAPVVGLDEGEELAALTHEDAAGPNLTWRVLVAERRDQAEAAIARFISQPVQDVRRSMREALRRVARPSPPGPWFYVPLAETERLGELLPDAIDARLMSLVGAPPSRERILLVQGDPSEGGGMYDLLCTRLAASLEMEPGEIAYLLELHGEEVRISSMERAYRVHLICFDRPRLARLIGNLERIYRAAGLEGDIASIEMAITAARRTADREWRGSTRHDPIVIEPDVPQQVAVDLAGAGAEVPEGDPIAAGFAATEPPLPGLRIVTRIGRDYPFDGAASHLVGWLGRVSARLDRSGALAYGLDPEGWTGTRGLESRYDEILQGVIGRQVRRRTPEGWDVLEHEARSPAAGTDLHTTLDIELQLAVEDALGRWLQLATDLGTIPAGKEAQVEAAMAISHGRAGMCVLDAHTGAVLALASTPGFELSEIRRRYDELVDPDLNPGLPLHDNATWAAQPPGSTLKPLVAIAAMVEGVYRPGEIIHTEGYMARWRGRGILGDHPPVARDWEMVAALQRSSNTFFATIAERLGPHKLSAWLGRFGIGQRQVVDIDWMRPGLLPTPETIARDRPAEPNWLTADTWRMGIGQFCTASPLQIAPLAACVANGGTILRPFLWRGAAEDAVVEQLELTPRMIAVLREGMELVTVSGGTAPWLRLECGVKVAAKTGTSEWGSKDSRSAGLTPDNGWLMGYAPADDPQVAFAIYVHAAGMSGGRSCSGIARQVLDTYFTQQARRQAGESSEP